ncbi:hypothetical protein BDV98DRAFT_265255 [Pterulicium gracile]|uniref:Uncharacterized protein n=1 Tax=Pterulicium gracile TaxID=1884261 RepID=A0A5C3Q5P6_9AGAR|nr:hypothetical protein BDV98DRAFT_265255 [Pterula gracilis]
MKPQWTCPNPSFVCHGCRQQTCMKVTTTVLSSLAKSKELETSLYLGEDLKLQRSSRQLVFGISLSSKAHPFQNVLAHSLDTDLKLPLSYTKSRAVGTPERSSASLSLIDIPHNYQHRQHVLTKLHSVVSSALLLSDICRWRARFSNGYSMTMFPTHSQLLSLLW